jgi:hypothetical protein
MNAILILIGASLGLIFILFILFVGENGNGRGKSYCNSCKYAPRCDGKNCYRVGDEEN